MKNSNHDSLFEAAKAQIRAAREMLREKLDAPKQGIFKQIAILMSHRLPLTLFLILVQIALVLLVIIRWTRYFVLVYFICVTISLFAVLHILNKKGHPDYKIAWIMPILILPLFGGMLYLLFGGNWASERSIKRLERMERLSSAALSQNAPIIEALTSLTPEAANQMRYIYNVSACPPYVDTETEYLPIGEVYYYRMVEELKKAEHYIFLQYFIIMEGVMWDSILDILEEKAAQGVDVRVIYDDIGSMLTLSARYPAELERRGIACGVFNPFVPVVSLRLNNRDHRKICVIDGHTALTGGLNLSDEYINEWERYGHWKDTGLLLHGDAVWSLTAMFLACWDYTKGIEEDFEQYRPRCYHQEQFQTDGVVQPYTSNPGTESVGAGVYLHLISRAKRYLYITTPYLVIDDAMMGALRDAALSGVDVRIITPHIPDKRYVFELTRAHYVPLLEAGVRIYEYTPGFIHAKTFTVDDEYGVVGTVNLDYRSLYLHYECGVWMYGSSAIASMKEDFLATLEHCQKVELEDAARLGGWKKLYRAVLRVIAPLM